MNLNLLICCLTASVFSGLSNALDSGAGWSGTTVLSLLLHSCNVTSINSAT